MTWTEQTRAPCFAGSGSACINLSDDVCVCGLLLSTDCLHTLVGGNISCLCALKSGWYILAVLENNYSEYTFYRLAKIPQVRS